MRLASSHANGSPLCHCLFLQMQGVRILFPFSSPEQSMLYLSVHDPKLSPNMNFGIGAGTGEGRLP